MTRSARDTIAEELASLLWDVDDETALANRILSRLAEEGFVVAPRSKLDALDFIETWINNPVSSYSVQALDGLFTITRGRLAPIEGREK